MDEYAEAEDEREWGLWHRLKRQCNASTTEAKPDMDRKIRHLARCLQAEAGYKASVAEAEAELKDSGLWRWLEQRRKFLAIASADVADAEANVREAALERHVVK